MKLKKALGMFDVFSIAAGAMVSSGLFVLPAVAFSIAGSGILWAYLFAGLLMIPALFSKLELATALPKSGGTYFFVQRILGSAAGTIVGFASWLSISLKSSFALVGIGAFAYYVFPSMTPMQIKLLISGICVFFTVLNIYSVKSSGAVQNVLVAALILILAAFILLGYRSMSFGFTQSLAVVEWKNVFYVTGMVFISYGGLTKVASIAEEVKNPGKNLVRGMIIAFAVVQVLYILVVIVLLGLLEPNVWRTSLTPVSTAAALLSANPAMQNALFTLTAIAAIFAFITTANAGLMSASRIPMAMSRDNHLPRFFAFVTPRRNIPLTALLFTTVFILLIINVLNIESLAKLASLFMLMLFVFVNAAHIVIRYAGISNYQPTFRSPMFPVLQVAGIAVYVFLMASMGIDIILAALGFILLAVLWYYAYSQRHERSVSAFVHMVARLFNKELVSQTNNTALEAEMLDILIERNDIVLDRFDSIIQNCMVLDINMRMTRNELFTAIAELVSEKLGLDAAKLKQKFIAREDDASTLIYPGVAVPHAIPHIIIEGQRLFDIVLVRNRAGIVWNDKQEIVHTAFTLIGSKDERDFHLRALMYIAQILQNPNFNINWERAKDAKEMKRVILLSKRRRHNT